MKILETESYLQAAERSGLQRTVFLAGPYIEIEKKPKRGKEHISSRLRHALFYSLSDAGNAVTMGEYTQLIAAYADALKTQNDAHVVEVAHARTVADAVIMLPSSPGSFLELGAFSLYEQVCKKMLIIVDKKYEKSEPNYLNTGPLRRAASNYAEISYIDYEDHAACFGAASEFIERQISKKMVEGFLA